ncbi:MAG: pectinesterase family protein [Planctomycetaceae bacterium]|nr:pectinesterase family protein [Planctomycetaceae bacterium]
MIVRKSGVLCLCGILPWIAAAIVGVCRAEPAPGYQLLKDIEYGQADGQKLLLDIALPQQANAAAGVILIHGGGWGSGDKQDMQLWFEPLTKAGFVCYSVNYRLAPEHCWPACIDDVMAAMRWVNQHGGEYRTDRNRVALMGYSAGGHLACMAAVQASKEVKPTAVVGLAAPTDHEADSGRRGGLSPSMQKLLDRSADIDVSRKLLRQISPIHYISEGLPPFLLVHGTEDKSVPYSQSIEFQKELLAKQVPCELITLPGAAHNIGQWEQFDPEYQSKIVRWLQSTLKMSGRAETPRVLKVGQEKGQFTTVQAAVDSIAEGNTAPIIIEIAEGIYKERVTVPRSTPFVCFKGNDAEKTVITFNLSARMKGPDGSEIGTFGTPTVTIEADSFCAEHITFENSAGDVGQALAVTVLGDRAVFKNCRFLGWQDTIYDQSGRHYYENCYIAGHCDFIFGGGTAFFESCHIHCLNGSYITAASTPQDQPYGYVFSNCTISGEPANAKTYLGRPWRDYANVIFLNTQMEGVIRPEGWHNWNNPQREKTARYAEYNSRGEGADTSARVGWSRQLNDSEAAAITAANVLKGTDDWNPLQ